MLARSRPVSSLYVTVNVRAASAVVTPWGSAEAAVGGVTARQSRGGAPCSWKPARTWSMTDLAVKTVFQFRCDNARAPAKKDAPPPDATIDQAPLAGAGDRDSS